ncbi:MAG: DUF2752 domain-containing protein [Armatimonadota bacterium]|jgi:hypothetical protein
MSANEARSESIEEPGRASRSGHRIEAAALLLLAAGVLALSWLLLPSAAGYGTHEQLLWLPCAFRWFTGMPCPVCGMTTAFALMARGQVVAALSAHALGPLLYVATWLLAACAAVALVRGRSPLPQWLRGARGAKALVAGLAVAWVANVAAHLLGL